MKFGYFILSSLLAISSALASPDSEPEARAPCAARRRAVPWYRAYNSQAVDHFYTTSRSEWQTAINNSGYKGEGTAGYIFSSRQPGTVPFYRDYNSQRTDHFYTRNFQESQNAIRNDGYRAEGITGWIYPDSSCGGVPLYRLYNPTKVDHFYTTSATERDSADGNGYNFEGIAGYILNSRS